MATWRNVLPAGTQEIRHGYTLDDAYRIARYVVRTNMWHRAMDTPDRLEAAWYAVVELLYSADQAPSGNDLIWAGNRAIDRLVRDEYHSHGVPGRDWMAGKCSAPNFQRYWWLSMLPAPSCENRVVERQALRQIWPRLTPRQRDALTALASTGDYQLAAGAMGVTLGTFNVQISKARKVFFALWHEGESPSRVWGTDRRIGSRAVGSVDRKRRPATKAVTRREGRRVHELVHGRSGTYINHGCHCRPCTDAASAKVRERRRAQGAKPRQKVTPELKAEAGRRRRAGESLSTIAAALGISSGHVSRITRGITSGAAA